MTKTRQWMMPEGQVVGTITIVYDHHARGLQSRLIELQHEHEHIGRICCSTHVHLDHDNCVEVMVIQGPAEEVRQLADTIISARGVKHGQLSCTGVTPLKHSH